MNFAQSTKRYETWLGARLKLIPADLRLKHARMREGLFPFLRGTFYRWAELWPVVCPADRQAPPVLAVGDLHVANFGTWRDGDGRLVWGINDFDEAAPMPYTVDLVRLASSALIARQEAQLPLKAGPACKAILEGYRAALAAGGSPIVLGERHHWLREMAVSGARDPFVFWERMARLPRWRTPISEECLKALGKAMPETAVPARIVHRIAGLGSLGRERYATISDWRGAKVAREAKALTTSAWAWAQASRGAVRIYYRDIVRQAVRSPDPSLRVHGRWVVRRLAHDCCRIDWQTLPKRQDEARMLYNMGWETANVHLGSAPGRRLVADLDRRPDGWLLRSARLMARATEADWEEWRATAGG